MKNAKKWVVTLDETVYVSRKALDLGKSKIETTRVTMSDNFEALGLAYSLRRIMEKITVEHKAIPERTDAEIQRAMKFVREYNKYPA